MNVAELVVREMKDNERQTVKKVGKRAFQFFETLFVTAPKRAMVAECDGKIIGGIVYQYICAGDKKTAYVAEAFVDPAYHGLGVGKKLYAETFRYLWDQGCDALTALVKDDNVASWKLFTDNGFKRVGLPEGARQLGVMGMIRQYFSIPLFVAVGMDFYMAVKGRDAREKRGSVPQAAAFLLANLLLVFPLWIRLFHEMPDRLLDFGIAYITVLAAFILPRYIAGLLNRGSCRFRLNNGGGFLTMLLSLFEGVLPMNANWYPNTYEATAAFRRKLAIPEMVKWCLFIALLPLAFAQSVYLQAVAQIACPYLIFMSIPIYPFESLGAGRIFRYSKKLWLVGAVISIVDLAVVFSFA